MERLPGRARRHHPRWDRLRVRIPKHVGDRQPERRPCRLPHIPGRHPVQAVRAVRASRLCQGMWSCAVPARDSEAGGDTQPWPSSSAAGITQAARQSPAEPPRRPCASTSGTPSKTTHDGAGLRDCLLLETRRAGVPRRPRAGPAAPVRRLARLLFRQAGRLAQRAGRWSKLHGPRPHTAIEHTERPQGMKSWWTTDQPQDRPRRHSHGTRLGRCRLPRRVIVQLPAAVSRSPYGRRMRSASPNLDMAPAPKGSAPIDENGAKSLTGHVINRC